MKDKSEREVFKDFCKTIKHIEKDKDAFLKASRLQRYERELHFSSDYLFALIMMGMVMAFMLTLIIFG